MAAERKYVCKVKCYYLNRLWKPGVPGSIEPDVLITDRDDVPKDWFTAAGPANSAAKKAAASNAKTKAKASEKAPPVK